MNNKENESGHIGSNFDDFLAEEGVLEEVTAKAVEKVAAWEVEEETEAIKTRRSGLLGR